uniref:Apelin receptor early endogenous ligand n=1 Tax=Sinocyclocheilus rhinocerous TaxID=307959 RepID=A0A673GE29_9TELE
WAIKHRRPLLVMMLSTMVNNSPNKSFFLPFPDFLKLRRKYRRHNCPKKRCLPLHSRVPFP